MVQARVSRAWRRYINSRRDRRICGNRVYRGRHQLLIITHLLFQPRICPSEPRKFQSLDLSQINSHYLQLRPKSGPLLSNFPTNLRRSQLPRSTIASIHMEGRLMLRRLRRSPPQKQTAGISTRRHNSQNPSRSHHHNVPIPICSQ